jgi:hypothetical protein
MWGPLPGTVAVVLRLEGTDEHAGAKVIIRSSRRDPMEIVGGIDIHRRQLTFDFVDLGTGENLRGRVAPADRLELRRFLARLDAGGGDVAMEGCTGWRYVSEELEHAGVRAHVAARPRRRLVGATSGGPRPIAATRPISASSS